MAAVRSLLLCSLGAGSGHVFGEPLNHALVAVAYVFRVTEAMASVGVDDELRLHAEVAERVPHLEALRSGALAVAVADDDEHGCLHLLDEGDGGGFGVDLRIVIDAGAEERDHPLVDGVFAVVAEPVGEAGAGDGSAEAMRLCDGEHGHETAVAPAGDAFAIFVDGVLGLDGVHAFEDVAQVTVTEVLAVGGGEGLALTKAAARIGLEDEVAFVGPHGGRARAGGGWG